MVPSGAGGVRQRGGLAEDELGPSQVWSVDLVQELFLKKNLKSFTVF